MNHARRGQSPLPPAEPNHPKTYHRQAYKVAAHLCQLGDYTAMQGQDRRHEHGATFLDWHRGRQVGVSAALSRAAPASLFAVPIIERMDESWRWRPARRRPREHATGRVTTKLPYGAPTLETVCGKMVKLVDRRMAELERWAGQPAVFD